MPSRPRSLFRRGFGLTRSDLFSVMTVLVNRSNSMAIGNGISFCGRHGEALGLLEIARCTLLRRVMVHLRRYLEVMGGLLVMLGSDRFDIVHALFPCCRRMANPFHLNAQRAKSAKGEIH
jgi:hypothetical protein